MPALAVNIGLFYLGFRIVTPGDVANRDLLPGVAAAGISWQVMQTIGVDRATHQIRHATQVYGFFGLTIGLLGFLYLAGQITVYAAEINAVRTMKLWPRQLAEPEPMTT